MPLEELRQILFDIVPEPSVEEVPLYESCGRILAQNVIAEDNVPPFDRSPYDGYAFRAADVASASPEHPVTLKVLEEIPAGGISHFPVTEGTAVRIMTGAPLPEGADTITMYEVTKFTDTEVTLFSSYEKGSNIVLAGEDVKKGQLLAHPGMVIDAALCATMASQNIPNPKVYKKLKVGVISTGSELVNVGEERTPGMIYDSNKYHVSGALKKFLFEPVAYPSVKDTVDGIADMLKKALDECDAVVTTGGVSVGDFDDTPAAIEAAGGTILFRGAPLKPGMACAYAVKGGKLICALSGNPASSITNFYMLALPALRKMAGYEVYDPDPITVTLAGDFAKKSKGGRIIHGQLDLTDGTAKMVLSRDQGNVIINTLIGADVIAVVPKGSGPLPAGTQLKAYLI